MQSPLLIRLLQGPHTDAQFYTSPVLDLHARYSRADHLRADRAPRMTDSRAWQGADEARPTLPAVPTAYQRGGIHQDWVYEVLAWLPFGLLLLALLDRAPAEAARLMGELGADVNSARSTPPRTAEPITSV